MEAGDFGTKGRERRKGKKNLEAGDCQDDYQKQKKSSSYAFPTRNDCKQSSNVDFGFENDSAWEWESLSSDDYETLPKVTSAKPEVDLSHIRSYPEFSSFFDDDLRSLKTLNMKENDGLNKMYEFKYSDYESDLTDKEPEPESTVESENEKTFEPNQNLAMSQFKRPEFQKALGNLRIWERKSLRLAFRNPRTPWIGWANYVQPPKKGTKFDKPQAWDMAPVSNLFNSIAVPKIKKPTKSLEGWRRPVSLPYALDFEEIKHGKDCCCCQFINMEGITSADQFYDMYLDRVTYNPAAHKLCMKDRCLRCRDAVREKAERKEKKEKAALRAKTGAPKPKTKVFK